MKIFNYSMESILNYRKNLEEEKKQRYSEIQSSYLKQCEILNGLKNKLMEINTRHIRGSQSEISLLKNQEYYKELLRQKIAKQEQRLFSMQRDLEEIRSQMAEAQKNRKIMEKHKENTFYNYLLDMNRQEQKFLDEYAMNSYVRK